MDNSKFLFDLYDFEDPDSLPENQEEVKNITYTQDDLDEAKKQAFEDGVAEGKQKADLQKQNETNALLSSIKQQINALVSGETARNAEFITNSLELCYQMYKTMRGDLEEKQIEHLRDTLNEILAQSLNHDQLRLAVPVGQADQICEMLAEIFSKSADILKDEKIVFEDNALEAGQCRMYWTDGGALYNLSQKLDTIGALLTDNLAARGKTVENEGEAVESVNMTEDEDKQEIADDE